MKAKFRQSLLAAALALAALPAAVQAADSPFTQTIFFGDSLTDSGFYRPFLVQVQGPSAAIVGQVTASSKNIQPNSIAHRKPVYSVVARICASARA